MRTASCAAGQSGTDPEGQSLGAGKLGNRRPVAVGRVEGDAAALRAERDVDDRVTTVEDMNRRNGRVLAHDEQTRADDTSAGHDRPNLNRSAGGAVDTALGAQRPRPGETASSRGGERLDARAGCAD